MPRGQLKNVVKMPAKIPPPPEWMGEDAAEHWRKIVPILHGRGMLTPERMPAIEALCSQAAEVRRCEIAMQGEPTIITGGNGAVRAHPVIAAKNKAAQNVLGLSKGLGLVGASAPPTNADGGPDELSDLGLD
jgi:P27 family predicted phage terminase small subunit